jgi:outer membrane protein TolC
MYNNRLTRIIDIKQAKMASFGIDTKTKEAKSKFKVAISYLQFLTADYTITDVKDFVIISLKNNELKTLQRDAITNRDDYRSMRYNTQTMKKNIKFESSDKYPTIGAHFEYGINDNAVSLSTNKDYYLGAFGLTYTLFDGDITKIKEQKAKIAYAKTKHYFEYMKEGIDLEVKKNLLEYTTNKNTLKEKKSLSKMAKDILYETENIYKNNLKFRTNMMYLLMSLQNMLEAQADVISSSYAMSISSAQLQLSTGKSLK